MSEKATCSATRPRSSVIGVCPILIVPRSWSEVAEFPIIAIAYCRRRDRRRVDVDVHALLFHVQLGRSTVCGFSSPELAMQVGVTERTRIALSETATRQSHCRWRAARFPGAAGI